MTWEPLPGAAKYETGGIPVLLAACVSEGINYVQALGLDKIRAHARQLTDRLQTRAAAARLDAAHAARHGNADSRVRIEGRRGDGQDAAGRQGDRRRSSANENRLRLSVSVFNTHDDIDRVVDVFRSAAYFGGRRRVSQVVKSYDQVMDTSESARLAALRSYRILDTDPEQAFDDIVLLASQICGTPISLITLVDEDRQWFKSRVGVVDRPRRRAACRSALTPSEAGDLRRAPTRSRTCASAKIRSSGRAAHPLLCRRAAGHARRSCARHVVHRRSRPAHADRRPAHARSTPSDVKRRRSSNCGAT